MTNLGGLFVYRSLEQGGGGGRGIDWGYLDERIFLSLFMEMAGKPRIRMADRFYLMCQASASVAAAWETL